MAEKLPEFPVVLEKDGAKRTAHTPIAYNQLKTQGFAESKAKSTGGRNRKTEAKAETKSEPKTEAKADAKADEAKSEK